MLERLKCDRRFAISHLEFVIPSSFVIRHSSFRIALSALSVFAEPPPSAKDILDSVRMVESRQQIDLQGQLRQDDMVIPFRLMQNGPLIRYTFTDPDETLELRLGENSSRLELVSDAGTEKVGASKLQEKIRGTIVLCGDLAFKFLYWPSCARVRRGKCPHPEMLETAVTRTVARVTVFERAAVGGQGERRTDAHGGLRLECATDQTL